MYSSLWTWIGILMAYSIYKILVQDLELARPLSPHPTQLSYFYSYSYQGGGDSTCTRCTHVVLATNSQVQQSLAWALAVRSSLLLVYDVAMGKKILGFLLFWHWSTRNIWKWNCLSILKNIFLVIDIIMTSKNRLLHLRWNNRVYIPMLSV